MEPAICLRVATHGRWRNSGRRQDCLFGGRDLKRKEMNIKCGWNWNGREWKGKRVKTKIKMEEGKEKEEP